MKQGLMHAGTPVHTDKFHVVAYRNGDQVLPQLVIENAAEMWEYIQTWLDFQNATMELVGVLGCEQKYVLRFREDTYRHELFETVLYLRNASDQEVATLTNEVFVAAILGY